MTADFFYKGMRIMQIRTRFAPSPTGFMHIGNLRTALYTYLIAKKDNGTFILRIEDTDQNRYVEGAVEVIYDTLRACGLNWDEGPDIGGEYGPYIQSERMELYKDYAEELIEKGEAYRCFCTKERMEELHAAQAAAGETAHYDRHCRDLSADEVQKLLDLGTPYVIRQKIPVEGVTSFNDIIYGVIETPNKDLDDQILIKADGMPTYNFANVVDDHLMGITHIVRGNEYLSSTPKYNLLYTAFGWDIPAYIHVEHIMRDSTHKLSKRDGDAYFGDFVEKGFYIPAIINYIALLGWSPKNEYAEQEIFTLNELITAFDVSGISKSPAIFDEVKMKAINAEWLRRMSPEAFLAVIMPYIKQSVKREDIDFALLAKCLQPRAELFTDIPEKVDFIDSMPEYSNDLYINKKMKTTPQSSKEALETLLPMLENLSDFSFDRIHAVVMEKITEMGVKNGVILFPLRTALSGKAMTPGGGTELAAILGKDETLRRIKAGITHIG
jgi:glutamyl-tRNA synthetase